MTRRQKVQRNRMILFVAVMILVFGSLFFIAYKETEYSRQFVTEIDKSAILW